MAVILRCPECEGKFKWAAGTEEWPKHCPLCGAYVGIDRADDDIVLPFIRSARAKSIDQVYRDIEKSSEHRAEQAAQMAGVPVSEMSGLKITDLNDRRDSEIAAPKVPDIGQKYASNGAELGGGIAAGAVTVNGQTVNGVAPRAGMNALKGLQRLNGRG